jgi:hypothetical protein
MPGCVHDYDVTKDSKPGIVAPTDTVSKRTLTILDKSVEALKSGEVSSPVDLARFQA